MDSSRYFISFIFSLIVASFAYYVTERLGVSGWAQQKIFGGIQNLGQLKSLFQDDWYKGIKTTLVMMLTFVMIYFIIYFIVFEIICLCYFRASSKCRKPRVFISYKNTGTNALVDTTKIAKEVRDYLESEKYPVSFFDYTDTLHHDLVNHSIHQMLNECEAMVVIPDPEHPSYVDSEIFYASGQKKPIFLIKYSKDQKLPSTANSGHTVLLWQKLKKEKMKPLDFLLQYVHQYWKSRLFLLSMPVESFLKPIMYLFDENIFYTFLVCGIAITVLILVSVSLSGVLLVFKLIIAAFGFLGAFLVFLKSFKDLHLHRIIKQAILNKGNSYKEYQKATFGKNILNCIDKVGLNIKD